MRLWVGLILTLFLCAEKAFGQEAVTALGGDVVGPLPATAQFGRFEAPVPSLATGAVSFPVDLYVVRAGEVEIPLRLCCCTQGVRVWDDPYPCGYGWSLLPSLRVTRTVLGRPDELYRRLESGRLPHVGADNDTLYRCVRDDNGAVPDSACLDTRHDLFTMALPGANFNFILERDAGGFTAVTAQKNGYRISADERLGRFVVTDPLGNRWQFGGAFTETAFETSVTTAWGLERVNTYKGDTIVVNWERTAHAGMRTFAPAEYMDYEGSPSSNKRYTDPEERASLITQKASNQNLHLRSIIFPEGKMLFEYSPTPARPMLSMCMVINHEGDTLRYAEFSYAGPGADHRLLSEIRIRDFGSYRFSYNEVDFSAYSARYAIDYWGYYNGRTTNTGATPKTTVKTRHTAGAAPDRLAVVGLADRTPDASSMTANTLTGVVLPSGGEVTFAYEPHRFAPQTDTTVWITDAPTLSFGGGLRVTSISVKENADAAPTVTAFAYGENENGLAECVALPHPSTFLTAREGLTTKETENSPIVQLFTCRSIDIHNESQYLLNHIGETPVWYREVAVYSGGGKTVHRFSDIVPPNGVRNEWRESDPCHNYNDLTDLRHAFSRGIVQTAQTEYERKNGTFSPIKETRSYYSVQDRSTDANRQIIDFTVKRTAVDRGVGLFSPDIRTDHDGHIWMSQSSHFPSPFETGHLFYRCQPYPVQFLSGRLDSTVTREYASNGAITDKRTYAYHDRYDFVKEVGTYRGDKLLTRDTSGFVFDQSGDSVLARLVAANRIAIPCSETTFGATGQVRRRTRTGYALFHGLALPSRVTADCGGARSFELKSYGYDGRHRITDIAYDNGSRREAFVWDKAGLHPVAGVAGKTSKEANVLFGDAISPDQGLGEPMWKRMARKSAGAIFAAYRHKDLCGLSSATTFNGVTTRYAYDGFGRLTEVAVNGKPTLANEYSVGDGEARTHISTRTFTQSDASRHIYSRQHYDGLFRPVRTVTGASADVHTQASLNEYDRWGRLSRVWSPAPVDGSGYPSISEIKGAAAAAYGGDACPYSEMSYIDAPVDSVAWRVGPGSAWHANGKRTVIATATNQPTGAYMCRKYMASDGGLTASGVWGTGELRVVTMTDEDGRTVRTFTDGEGRTVLKRCETETGTGTDTDTDTGMGAGKYADTYFVYDDRGLLRCVLPPEASARLEKNPAGSKDIIANLCYVYAYDDLSRCVSKRLPGREPVLMRYDRGGRLCLEQDGNMRVKGEWLVTLRDEYGRTAVTARAKVGNPDVCDSVLFRADYTGDGALCGYAVSEAVGKMLSGSEIERVYYYDNYHWLSNTASDSLAYRDMPGYDNRYRCGAAPELSAAGLCTGEVTRVYGGNGGMLASAVYYDERGNVVQRHQKNHLGGYEHFYRHLTFTGKPLKIRYVHSTRDTIITDIVRYTYDTMERQLTISHDHNGAGEALLSGNAYDRLGRLAASSLNDGGCEIAYAYNVRGWTRGVAASVGATAVFSQTLHYEDAPSGGTPCWGGNISGISWRQRESMKAATPTESLYRFTYDALSRLTRADYSSDGAQWNGDLVTQGDRDFSCSYAYDLNGNVLSLKRHGVNFYSTAMPTHIRSFGVIDDLTMTYSGNQLQSVTDRAEELTYAGAMDFKDGADSKEEYTYDANGNMTSDLNRGITRITYNPLNLPETVLFSDGHETRYTYAADGRKLRAQYLLSDIAIIDTDKAKGEASTLALDGTVTAPGVGELPAGPAVATLMTRDYCGSHIYRNGKLERTLTDGGYIQDGKRYFYIKDYQGNVRAVLNQQNQPVELTSYYPYGGIMASTATEGVQPYKYGGKELDRENGLDWYDSRARYYDSQIGRTPTQDPKAESYPHLTPYLWCAANPIRLTDPSGMVIKLADNSLSTFKVDYSVAYNYLKKNNASFVLDDLDSRNTVFVLKECADNSRFDAETNTIHWNPHRALLTTSAYTLTPAELLSHEADHALEFDKNPDEAIKRLNISDENYGNKDDKRVIEGSEQEVAKRIGRVQEFGVTRLDHYGTGYYVVSADSYEVEGVSIIGIK